MRPILTVGLLAVGLLAGACSKGGDSPPPQAVVHGAATLSGQARIYVDGPDGRHAEGDVDLGARTGSLTLTAPASPARTIGLGAAVPPPFDRPEYANPPAVLELVRYAERIDPFGGLLVRGTGAVRYDVHIRPPGQAPFFADVYVDRQGRLRRLTVPEDRNDHRVKDSEYRLARLITIDVVYR